MTDKQILLWIIERLVNKHGENRNADYMIRLTELAKKLK